MKFFPSGVRVAVVLNRDHQAFIFFGNVFATGSPKPCYITPCEGFRNGQADELGMPVKLVFSRSRREGLPSSQQVSPARFSP